MLFNILYYNKLV